MSSQKIIEAQKPLDGLEDELEVNYYYDYESTK